MPLLASEELTLSPNPASTEITIRHATDKIEVMKIFDSTGKQIYYAQPATQTVRLDVTG